MEGKVINSGNLSEVSHVVFLKKLRILASRNMDSRSVMFYIFIVVCVVWNWNIVLFFFFSFFNTVICLSSYFMTLLCCKTPLPSRFRRVHFNYMKWHLQFWCLFFSLFVFKVENKKTDSVLELLKSALTSAKKDIAKIIIAPKLILKQP